VSAGYRQQFSYRWQPAISVGANYGQQHSTTGRLDLVPRTTGVNAGVSFTPAPKWGVSLDYIYLQSDYQAPDIIIGDTRHDKYQAFIGAVTYLISRNLSVRAEAQLARNQSNIDLYAFPRDVYVVKMRYEFK
jgi:predicted porin